MADKQTFEAFYPALLELVEKRKKSWRLLSVMEWEDARMVLLERLWEKFPLYDQSRPLDKWVNTVVSNTLMNLSRDHLYRFARPCIAGDAYGNPCVFNTGGNGCSKTPSKIQCGECRFYAEWQHKKEAKFNVASMLALENHLHEAYSAPEEGADIEAAKAILDEKILSQLNPHEQRLYHMLYIDHMTMEEVGRKMRYKTQRNSKVAGYQVLLKFSRKIKALARQIIQDYELV